MMRTPAYQKILFYPTVDEFSMLKIDGSWTHPSLMRWRDMEIRLEVGKIFSPWQRVFSTDMQFVVPFLTAIIELNDGAPVQITWDQSCVNCDGGQCISGNFCGVPYNVTGQNTDGICYGRVGATDDATTDCDLKIYLGWFGSDSSSNYLVSAGQRYSAFRKYSAKGAYDSAATTFDQTRPKLPTDLPNEFSQDVQFAVQSAEREREPSDSGKGAKDSYEWMPQNLPSNPLAAAFTKFTAFAYYVFRLYF